ncbi:DNA-binding protein [Pseudomonas nitroreducens]|uniref:DNA-binding protein n=1 Tax=Pseudomonas nitroreducens TaxID=46680 RepID=UPI0020A035D5|nr:DNA-binding protein [Pseudomonas nitroreducens]MCP1623628.1 chromosome segregation ATPase [Pseudomonas nitroreducens]
MARGGITKALVQKARSSILARGDNPSIDALRVEMGNTGSKSTIHRYLKEVEAENAPRDGQPRSLSDNLTELVAQLAGQMHQEARQSVAEDRAALARERVDYLQQVRNAQAQVDQLKGSVQALESQLLESRDQLQTAQEQKHQSELANARLRQVGSDLETRLRERDAQILSLEEKHNHARLTLDHFRQAAKEQREQELRQHEGRLQQAGVELRQLQQTLIIRQDEVTQLNRDNERLLTEARLLRNDGETKQQQIVREALASEVLRQDKARLDGQRMELEEQNQQLSDELRTAQLMVQDHLILIASLQERLQKSEQDVP